ncbi:MAG: HEAT repeat domain-containing protein [Deltaproteobacteria bacterium]|nr:HEAT repeat domain-containing protein [Deltaproteobacteria bacterium]
MGCATPDDHLRDSLLKGNLASRIGAAKKLAEIKDDSTTNALITALRDYSSDVRIEACNSLSGRGMVAVSPVLRLMKDSSISVRMKAVDTLETLPETDEVSVVMIKALDDSSMRVRDKVVNLLEKRKWPRQDILILRRMIKRMDALEDISMGQKEDNAVGFDQIGKLGFPLDDALVYGALFSKDSFVVSKAIKVITDGSMDHLDVLLALPTGEIKNKSLKVWLSNTWSIKQKQITKIISAGIPIDTLFSILTPEVFKPDCSTFNRFKKYSLFYRGLKCTLPDKISPQEELVLRYSTGLEIPPSLMENVFSRITSGSPKIIEIFVKNEKYRDKIITLMNDSWKQFKKDYEKWIPESMWQKLELMGSDVPTVKPRSDREKFLAIYKSRVNVTGEEELFLPTFNAQLFSDRLLALKGIFEARELLIKVASFASGKIKANAIEALYPSIAKLKMPPVVLKNLDNPDDSIRKAALITATGHMATTHILKLLKDPSASIRQIVLDYCSKNGGKEIITELKKEFSEKPTADLALALGKIKVRSMVDSFITILDEDSLIAMYSDRAAVLRALSMVNTDKSSTSKVCNRELWHPDVLVRSEALRCLGKNELFAEYSEFASERYLRRFAAWLRKK